jgi:hypothetical protein
MNCVAKVRSHKALCGFANSACAKPGSHLRRTQVVPQLWQIWPPSGNFMTFLEILLISMPWDQRCVQLRCQGCQRIHPRTADATLRAFVQNHSIFICLRLLDECAQPFQSFIAYPQQPSSFVNDLYILYVAQIPLLGSMSTLPKGGLNIHSHRDQGLFVKLCQHHVQVPTTGASLVTLLIKAPHIADHWYPCPSRFLMYFASSTSTCSIAGFLFDGQSSKPPVLL